MNLFLVIIALLLIVCIDHEVRINRLENDNENEITEGQFGVPPMIWVFFGVCLVCLVLVLTGVAEMIQKIAAKFIKRIFVRDTKPTDPSKW